MRPLRDRLGILTDEVSDDFAASLAWIAERGLRLVEVRVVDGRNVADLDDAAVREVRRKLDARGLGVSAVASPLFKCALDPSREVASGDRFGQTEEGVEAHFAKLDRLATIAGILG